MEITLAFLLVALAAYTLFGGADFGGGILEATLPRHPHLRRLIQDTLAPVWEANHVWLIAVVVILFVGFPAAYAELCTALFVPLSLALLGIALRGAFFTFRKYDPEPQTRERFYSALFHFSSALTPLMYGLIVASLLTPFPPRLGSATFWDLYVRPWATVHGLLCAAFVYSLFGYVAAVFLYGEVRSDEDRLVVERRILQFFAATFVAGAAVLAYGAAAGIVAPRQELNLVQIAAHTAAFAGIPWLWHSLRQTRIWRMRLIAGAQVGCILAGWFSTQYPTLLRYGDGRAVTLAGSAAPAVTLLWLNIGLAVVLTFVVPLLAYLYRVFAESRPEEGSTD